MHPEDLDDFRGVKAAFQYRTTVTDLEFLAFWESLDVGDKLKYQIASYQMGFIPIGHIVVKIPGEMRS